jgi:cytochrome P450
VDAEKDERATFGEILANAQGYIVAGSDSTAVCLTYLIWAVCKRPLVQDRLVKELATIPPGYNERDLRDLPYLASLINETLRLYSPVPSGLPREVPAQGADVAGYWLKGGITVCAQAYSMHRDPVVFPNPEEFDPTRWENPTKAMTDSFMPFGRGSRGTVTCESRSC